MGLTASRLRTRVRIERQSDAVDGFGQRLDTWTEVFTCWADVLHTTGLEVARAGGEISAARASIRIRYRTGITAAMRLVHISTGQVYNIKAPLPDLARREHVDLVCEATQ